MSELSNDKSEEPTIKKVKKEEVFVKKEEPFTPKEIEKALRIPTPKLKEV